jgi:acyl-CoA synthetase (AMP-forming)/AMP-acid ligase II
MIGTTTAGTISNTSPASLTLVKNIRMTPPNRISTLRSATDTEEQIRQWCRGQLAAYKAPRRVTFVDEMPIEAAKIRKRELVAATLTGEDALAGSLSWDEIQELLA